MVTFNQLNHSTIYDFRPLVVLHVHIDVYIVSLVFEFPTVISMYMLAGTLKDKISISLTKKRDIMIYIF